MRAARIAGRSPGDGADEDGGGESAWTGGDACRRRGVRRLGIPSELSPAWRPSGLETIEDAELSTAQLETLDGVLTGCELAIAETGTVVLAGSATDGRRALTLVPDFYVCVVEAERIVELVPEAISRLGSLVRDHRRPLMLVTGPSATSDIELASREFTGHGLWR
jgi:L-lactate dehydrogenase complex protein LldG